MRKPFGSKMMAAMLGATVMGAATFSSAQSVVSTTNNATSSQQVLQRPVSVDLENVSLWSAISAIGANADVVINCQRELLDASTTPVTLHVRNTPLGVVLEQVLSGSRLQVVASAENIITLKPITNTRKETGGIHGTVTDAKSKQPLPNVTIIVDNAKRGVATVENGTYRFSNLAVGTHKVTARVIGHVHQTKTVTVTEGETATLNFSLEESANPLEQVVVTGTVTPTELKAVPNAITVITAKEIEQRGITHLDQLFRGDVPGLWVQNQGSYGLQPGQVAMQSRGNTSVDPNSAQNRFVNHPIKTYVDGVELADPSYLGLIDPRSIERVEIIPGPQASTIYGANAVNGVMQVFTKHGSPRPQLTFALQSGFIQNNYRSALTPQHDYSGQISNSSGGMSYNAGVSWTYMGPWTPAVHTASTSGFAGVHVEQGKIKLDGSYRRVLGTNWQNGSSNQIGSNLAEQGLLLAGDGPPPIRSDFKSAGQTAGLTTTVTPSSWWSHTLTVGSDVTESGEVDMPQFANTGDSSQRFIRNTNTRTSVAYTTTLQGAFTSGVNGTLSLGMDGWKDATSGIDIHGTNTNYTSEANFSRDHSRDRGGFINAQVGIFDQVFLTYGLRSEWNPNYGKDQNPNLTPRYGISLVRDVGGVTTKLRGSYGTATQVPVAGLTEGLTACQLWAFFGATTLCDAYNRGFGKNFYWTLPNRQLLPTIQHGGEGGVELYFGNQGSLNITYFNQTVTGVIFSAVIDSVQSSIPARDIFGYDPRHCYPCGYWQLQSQSVNGADVRNNGATAVGSWTIGPLTATGTYSWTKSRVIGVTPAYRWQFPYLVPGGAFRFSPEHTFALGLSYSTALTTVSLNMQGQGSFFAYGDPNKYLNCSFRFTTTCFRLSSGRINMSNPAYGVADLNATRRLSRAVEGTVQVQNLANSYRFDQDNVSVIGRQTKLGLRIRM